MGIHKYIESPEIFEQLFNEYVESVKSKPRFIHQVDRSGKLVKIPQERPLTLEGFEIFVCTHPNTKFKGFTADLSHYFENKDNRYSDFVHICTRVKKQIRADQIEGGMVGQYNPSITQRLNGLTEKTESNNTHTITSTTIKWGDDEITI